MYKLAALLALTMLVACTPSSSTSSTTSPAVRSNLAVVPDGSPGDASILVARYQEWDADGQRVPDIELDHSHGPDEVEDEEEVVLQVRSDREPLPIEAVDAEGDRVYVDLDALPMGPQTLRLTVTHDGLTSDELAVSVIDRRLAAP